MTAGARTSAAWFLVRLCAAVLAVASAGCDGGTQAPAPSFFADRNPDRLSAWGQFDVSGGTLVLGERVAPYDLSTPLFTDYALKLRTIWIPDGLGPGRLRADEVPDFPVGTVISKTFYYARAAADGPDRARLHVLKQDDASGVLDPRLADLARVHLVETRLLVHRATGWEPVSYIWNQAQDEAYLARLGDVMAMSLNDGRGGRQAFAYIVPDINQCASCHAPNNTTRAIEPLGVRERHLNRQVHYRGAAENQLAYLHAAGLLAAMPGAADALANADWRDPAQPLALRARAYLDINCAHCHNPVGPADTSGLDLTATAEHGLATGLCKLPIAAGSGTGGRAFSIVPGAPDASILVHRMETTDPAAMMPELGRALAHDEGVALIRRWVAAMEGSC